METNTLLLILIFICYFGFGLIMIIQIDIHDSSALELKKDKPMIKRDGVWLRIIFPLIVLILWPIILGLPVVFGVFRE